MFLFSDICTRKSQLIEPPYEKWKLPKSIKNAIITACSVIFALICVWVGFWITRVRRRYLESKIEAFADAHTASGRNILFGKYLDEWEITAKELKVDANDILGQGAFAVVYRGHLKKMRKEEWLEMDVAAKFSRIHTKDWMREDIIKEIGFMKSLGQHPNLLIMVGYVKSIENPVICTELCVSSLLNVLRKHPLHFMSKHKCNDVEICLLLKDLLKISLEVCSALIYMTQKGYVHRDIAARNVLLNSELVAKLSDFGLCRQVDENGECVESEGQFPVKHMAPEALKYGRFSEKSELWSYGILVSKIVSIT
jgi:hypothetical protein